MANGNAKGAITSTTEQVARENQSQGAIAARISEWDGLHAGNGEEMQREANEVREQALVDEQNKLYTEYGRLRVELLELEGKILD
jgi:hypothetical protein